METLRELLHAECTYRMQEETMDRFLELMSEVKLKKNEPLVPYDARDSNMYVLKSGILRIAYLDGDKELTHAFGMPGTMTCAYNSFILHKPTPFKIEACCESTFMKITKAAFVELTRRSNDFAQWVMWMFLYQTMFYEKKLLVVNGNARERFASLAEVRPEIIKKVALKHIASYIGITPEYLSKLKREFMLKQGK